MIRGEDIILANIEEPDFGFLDPNRPEAKNMIALLSKQTFKTLDTFALDRFEVANTVIQIDKKVSGLVATSAQGSQRNQPSIFVLIGTAYIDEETMPSRGRLLIFKISPKDCRMQLVHELKTPGSIQCMATLKENHKYLALGINNRVILYSLNLKHGNSFDIISHDSKVSGTFAQCMKTIDSQIVVGDIMKGVMVFDVKEGRQGKV
jgi:hypothetical protein